MFTKSSGDGLDMEDVTDRIIRELEEICELEGDGFRKGSERRKLELKKWLDEHIIDFEADIPVVNKKYLTSENKDAIIYKLSQVIAEKLIDDGLVDVETLEKSIKTKIKVLK